VLRAVSSFASRAALVSLAMGALLSEARAADRGDKDDEDAPRRAEVRETAAPPAAHEPPRTYAAFKVGPATAAAHPQMCAEVTPLEMVGVEACGTGAGFLYNDGSREIAHFRLKGRLAAFDVERVRFEPWVAGGFAELQIADDAPGFDFFGTGPFGVETSGPEAGASVRALVPVALGVELVAEAGVGIAWFPYAPQLREPQAAIQPQASMSVGFGF
jgi:hypothetical protein